MPSDYLKECLTYLGQLSFKKFEVILLPDDEIDSSFVRSFKVKNLRIIPTGEVSPAVKRDIGAEHASGDFLAFIDDDAYPSSNWLDIAYDTFSKRPEVVAIGGPAITPPSDPFWARVSGAVFLSRFSGGAPERYVPLFPMKFVDDWPTVNLIVRKEAFEAVGGFNSKFWPGEDTLFCREITKKGGKILYLPDLLIWHHRRPNFRKHLRQVGNYGLHRGFFAKRYPENSRKFKYFIPSLWTIFSILSLPFLSRGVYFPLIGFGAYSFSLLMAINDIRKWESLKVALLSPLYIVPTHYWYGIKFIQGFLKKNIKSTLGR
ncbi:MAG: glycosyltransferase [Candidatus Desulfofervidaceae bacterium]|nr:glycosyltransferase [Candidatus Desulfofervidaceae bacterium]